MVRRLSSSFASGARLHLLRLDGTSNDEPGAGVYRRCVGMSVVAVRGSKRVVASFGRFVLFVVLLWGRMQVCMHSDSSYTGHNLGI